MVRSCDPFVQRLPEERWRSNLWRTRSMLVSSHRQPFFCSGSPPHQPTARSASRSLVHGLGPNGIQARPIYTKSSFPFRRISSELNNHGTFSHTFAARISRKKGGSHTTGTWNLGLVDVRMKCFVFPSRHLTLSHTTTNNNRGRTDQNERYWRNDAHCPSHGHPSRRSTATQSGSLQQRSPLSYDPLCDFGSHPTPRTVRSASGPGTVPFATQSNGIASTNR